MSPWTNFRKVSIAPAIKQYRIEIQNNTQQKKRTFCQRLTQIFGDRRIATKSEVETGWLERNDGIEFCLWLVMGLKGWLALWLCREYIDTMAGMDGTPRCG